MKSILYFDSMLTPRIITFVYWMLLLMAVLGGLTTMFSGVGGFVMSLFMIVGGAVGARIGCELMIVLFKMNEALQELRQK
ncbi:MAG: hypothetical protein C0509_03045 [Acinetobacter sp.]|nr:hypothetical protein [Acinetobacter sp.]